MSCRLSFSQRLTLKHRTGLQVRFMVLKAEGFIPPSLLDLTIKWEGSVESGFFCCSEDVLRFENLSVTIKSCALCSQHDKNRFHACTYDPVRDLYLVHWNKILNRDPLWVSESDRKLNCICLRHYGTCGKSR